MCTICSHFVVIPGRAGGASLLRSDLGITIESWCQLRSKPYRLRTEAGGSVPNTDAEDAQDAMRNLMVGALAGAAMLAMAAPAQAQTPVKVMVFPGLSNFSIFAAQHNNLFAKHGLAVELAQHAQLGGAAHRPCQGRSSDRACRGRQRGCHGRTRQGGYRHRHRRRQRLQPYLRPARDQLLCRPAGQDRGGRRSEHRFRPAACTRCSRTTASTKATT